MLFTFDLGACGTCYPGIGFECFAHDYRSFRRRNIHELLANRQVAEQSADRPGPETI